MRFVFRNDPCGIACVVFTYFLLCYADFVVVQYLAPSFTNSHWKSIHLVLFNLVLILSLTSHIRASISDPGEVPISGTKLDFSDLLVGSGHDSSEKGKEDRDDGWTLCNKCESYRPPRAHHCRICRRCIRRMDHHCPWINNCVGELNQKFFILFLIYTGLACVYALILTIVAMVKGFGSNRVQPAAIICSVFLIMESIIFLLFVSFIGCDQFQGIFEDMTQVEWIQKKSPMRHRKSRMALLGEVFGRGHCRCRYLCWILPTSPNLSRLSSNRFSQA
ncbi:palmitoyltransferase ZDHHC7-like [Oscarella lobularis]|uniref:palmitoyltransferase ZDHHC7-like n=1 Tax=Oscarella lobularis TaxID=121494 RepID=UPI0033135538